jgi:hypothetical protein
VICLIPNDAPVREGNACHKPGGAGGGQFCGAAGGEGGIINVSGSGSKYPTVNLFPWTSAPDVHRFLFYPNTGTFILGGEYAEGTHAEDLVKAQRKGAETQYDEYVKGLVTSQNPRAPGGRIEFIHAEIGVARGRGWEDKGQVADRYMKAVEFFLKHGATANTKLDGIGHFLPGHLEGQSIGVALPSFVARKPIAPRRRPNLKKAA